MRKIKAVLLKITILLGVASILSACQSTAKTIDHHAEDNTAIDSALMESAAIIADSQRVIARSENAIRMLGMTPAQREEYRRAKEVVLPNMANPIPLYHDGELEQSVRVLAQMTDYEFEVRSPERRPRGGIMISIQSDGRPAQVLIEELGNQAGTRADVTVMPFSEKNRRTGKYGLISLVYL